MTPEQLVAISSSVVAIAIALIGAVEQWRNRLADNSRLAAQREADDKRWTEQRSMDESRWSKQLRAEESRAANEHQRQLEVRQLERQDEQAKGRMENLRTDAIEFVTVFEEALVIARRVSERLVEASKQDEWNRASEIFAAWNSDLPVRLSSATAKLRLHGTSVGDPASAAHTDLTGRIRSMFTNFAAQNSPDWYVMPTDEDLFRAVIEAVVLQLGEDEPSGGDSS